MSHGRSQRSLAEAFGLEFRALMTRLAERYDSLARAADEPDGRARLRSAVAAEFAAEAEGLIAKHLVPDPVAEYVRHVVREGFDVDFDLMDPTDVALRAQASGPGARPAGPGALAPDR